jgi:hypothetical protein
MPEVHHNEILSWEADKDGSKNNFHLIFLRDQKNIQKLKIDLSSLKKLFQKELR